MADDVVWCPKNGFEVRFLTKFVWSPFAVHHARKIIKLRVSSTILNPFKVFKPRPAFKHKKRF